MIDPQREPTFQDIQIELADRAREHENTIKETVEYLETVLMNARDTSKDNLLDKIQSAINMLNE